ncbi:MAG: rhodanese-like domain-containing protein [Phycisphaerales bacterium]|nr:MAG: rhodanese-like domain-containing protein [Phycisphaerales bacterium]
MKIKTVCVEILGLCVVAGVCGVAANAINPDGIALAKNYFKLGASDEQKGERTAPVRVEEPASETAEVSPAADRNGQVCENPPDKECIRVDENGLNLACFDFVYSSWVAAQQGEAAIVFLDARDEDGYVDDHVPGAVLVNHYRQAKYLPAVMPRLMNAETIFVYCSGGDCEDSRFLASSLIYDHGLSSDTVFVYEGGIEEWIAKGKPTRKGNEP